MGAEFSVKQFHNVGGVSSVITGVVESGELIEGAVGVISQSKKFTVVKIEKDGQKINKADRGEKVNISVKYLSRSDVRMNETFHF